MKMERKYRSFSIEKILIRARKNIRVYIGFEFRAIALISKLCIFGLWKYQRIVALVATIP